MPALLVGAVSMGMRSEPCDQSVYRQQMRALQNGGLRADIRTLGSTESSLNRDA